MVLKIEGKELKIKFGYEATLKTRLLSHLANLETERNSQNDLTELEDLLLFVPEFLLVGLQKFHRDEYGYDYETGDGKEERIELMFALIDQYLDANEDNDILTIYNNLTEELLKNGILKSRFKEAVEAEKNRTEKKEKETAP